MTATDSKTSPSWVEPAVMAALVFMLAFCAHLRNDLWGDELSIWLDASSKSPALARPHNNVGSALVNSERYEEAIGPLKKALEADPWYLEPHYNLGVSYIKLRRFEDAIEPLERVLSINEYISGGHHGARYLPKYMVETHSNLGNVYNVLGKSGMAIEHYRKALEFNPADTSTRFNLAITLKREGRLDEAAEEFKEVLKYNPGDRGARANLMMLGGG